MRFFKRKGSVNQTLVFHQHNTIIFLYASYPNTLKNNHTV
ncbi:hypothetical protein BFV94_2397 [Alteromonas macleodii]|uniref:Uncharacterized protein n=1 Tax=Alteromonas macleodii TaxID=28108 RepID=A0AB36FSS7_ALTMA|nr:hypothetical protein BFV93_2392 [Alteromonas macleodii]OES31152.1 hypothetical protein BFV95_2398 [Alteromonas macleodii]OES31809.1 hypothetical protein BFV94_2397 [Alteromonas macleodii]OES41151.1 hypothetical protein BFV96_2384 [Alteromonas macleodii]